LTSERANPVPWQAKQNKTRRRILGIFIEWVFLLRLKSERVDTELEKNGVARSVRNNLRGRFQAHRADLLSASIDPMPDWGKSRGRSEEIHNTRIIRNAPRSVNG
jgi:hypothetical protein